MIQIQYNCLIQFSDAESALVAIINLSINKVQF